VVSGPSEDVLHLREALGLIPCEREDWYRMFVVHDGPSLSSQVDVGCSKQHKAPSGSSALQHLVVILLENSGCRPTRNRTARRGRKSRWETWVTVARPQRIERTSNHACRRMIRVYAPVERMVLL
jgi:hypothetical protein